MSAEQDYEGAKEALDRLNGQTPPEPVKTIKKPEAGEAGRKPEAGKRDVSGKGDARKQDAGKKPGFLKKLFGKHD